MANSKKNHNLKSGKQKELFSSNSDLYSTYNSSEQLEQDTKSILEWRSKILNHQKKVLDNISILLTQKDFINEKDIAKIKHINPFLLTAYSINFWRSNKPVHDGPAIYFVLDSMNNSQVILYIGETNSADKRWKGDHDCKIYINNYKESLINNRIESHLEIRLFLDVPKEVKLRRKLEKELIYLWFPPFNKETRSRWSTTFTNI